MTEEKSITIDASKKKAKPIEGKTKIVQRLDDTIAEITTKDILTANDALKKAEIPVSVHKTIQTCNVFELLKMNGVEVAFLQQTGDNKFLTKYCQMLPLEFVIRSRPYGSYLKRNPSVPLEPFETPITELFHKLAVVGPVTHHVNLDMIYNGYRQMTEERARKYFLIDGKWIAEVYTDPYTEIRDDKMYFYDAKKPVEKDYPLLSYDSYWSNSTMNHLMNEYVLPTFKILYDKWREFDIELVDLKIELGRDINEPDKYYVADVIDNDSWRIWRDGDPTKQLDKQNFRDGKDLDSVLASYEIVTEYTKKFL